MTEELNKTLIEEIAELLENRKFIKLRSILDEMHAEDIALLFEDFSPKELLLPFPNKFSIRKAHRMPGDRDLIRIRPQHYHPNGALNE